MSQWMQLAQKSLEHGDGIEKTFDAHYNKKFGHLIMSHKQLVFVTEEGMFKKTYNQVVNLPYNQVAKTSPVRPMELEITDATGKKYDFSFDMEASVIQKSLEDLMSNPKP